MRHATERPSDDRTEFLLSIGIEPRRWAQPTIPDVDRMKDAIDGLIEYGFSHEEACMVASRFPQMLAAPREPTRTALLAFEARGFTREEVMKMALRWPSFLAYRKERLDRVLVNLEAYGFSHDVIRKMVKLMPAVLCYRPERTNAVLENLEAYGFQSPEVRKMAAQQPGLLCFTPERTNIKLANLEAQGLTRPEVREMLKRMPGILCYKPTRMNEGIAALLDFGFDPRINVDMLLCAPALLRGRAAVLMALGIEITAKRLTEANAVFARKYGLTRAQVIARDPFRAADQKTAPL